MYTTLSLIGLSVLPICIRLLIVIVPKADRWQIWIKIYPYYYSWDQLLDILQSVENSFITLWVSRRWWLSVSNKSLLSNQIVSVLNFIFLFFYFSKARLLTAILKDWSFFFLISTLYSCFYMLKLFLKVKRYRSLNNFLAFKHFLFLNSFIWDYY